MAWMTWILAILLTAFNIFVGSTLMQVKEELRALRRSMSTKGDPFILPAVAKISPIKKEKEKEKDDEFS